MPDPYSLSEDLARLVERIRAGVAYNGQPMGPEVVFSPLTAPEFYALPTPPYEEMLGPLIVRGYRLVVGGITGEGKSTFVWWAIKALATGTGFLDWHARRAYRVLVVDAEQSEHDLKRILLETKLHDNPNVTILHVPDGLSLDAAADQREQMENLLAESFDAVVLDPFYRLHVGDPSDERQMVALMKMFDSWRIRYNFALIIPSHMRKPQSGAKSDSFTMHDIFGASAYLRGAETIVGIRLRDAGVSALYFFKSRAPGLPVRAVWTLRFTRDSGYAIYETPTERSRRDAEALEAQIRSLLRQAGGAGLDAQTIMEVTGKSRSTVYRILGDIDCRQIRIPGQGKRQLYVLSDIEPSQIDMEIWSDPTLDESDDG